MGAGAVIEDQGKVDGQVFAALLLDQAGVGGDGPVVIRNCLAVLVQLAKNDAALVKAAGKVRGQVLSVFPLQTLEDADGDVVSLRGLGIFAQGRKDIGAVTEGRGIFVSQLQLNQAAIDRG